LGIWKGALDINMHCIKLKAAEWLQVCLSVRSFLISTHVVGRIMLTRDHVTLRLLGRCSITYATLRALFCVGYFQDRVSWTIFSGWPWIEILLISALPSS
jgi:hypothetical protein